MGRFSCIWCRRPPPSGIRCEDGLQEGLPPRVVAAAGATQLPEAVAAPTEARTMISRRSPGTPGVRPVGPQQPPQPYCRPVTPSPPHPTPSPTPGVMWIHRYPWIQAWIPPFDKYRNTVVSEIQLYPVSMYPGIQGGGKYPQYRVKYPLGGYPLPRSSLSLMPLGGPLQHAHPQPSRI